MFSYWRNRQTGDMHMSLAGTTWPPNLWEQVSEDDYYAWKRQPKTRYASLADSIGQVGEAMVRAVMNATEANARLTRAIKPLVNHYTNQPLPWEGPVDYVLRVGAKSGHNITPGEAWRFRANLDWWNEDKQDEAEWHNGSDR